MRVGWTTLFLAASMQCPADLGSKEQPLQHQAVQALAVKDYPKAARLLEEGLDSELKKTPLSEEGTRIGVRLFELYSYTLRDFAKAKKVIERILKTPGLTEGQTAYFKDELSFLSAAAVISAEAPKKVAETLLSKYDSIKNLRSMERDNVRQDFELAVTLIPTLKPLSNRLHQCWLDLFYSQAQFELNLSAAKLEMMIGILEGNPKNACTLRATFLLKEYAGRFYSKGKFPVNVANAIKKFETRNN
jgi:hypothetical protein